MSAPVTTLFAALLALLYFALSLWVIRLRQTLRIGIGDGGNHEIKRVIRVHANFGEYVPMALILMFLAEQAGARGETVVAGAMLLTGRLAHAFGLSRNAGVSIGRFGGTTLTFLAFGVLVLACLRASKGAVGL